MCLRVQLVFYSGLRLNYSQSLPSGVMACVNWSCVRFINSSSDGAIALPLLHLPNSTMVSINRQEQLDRRNRPGQNHMVWTVQTQSGAAIRDLVEQILSAGQINRQEHLQLASTILSDFHITEEERRQINRIFDFIQIGRLKLVD